MCFMKYQERINEYIKMQPHELVYKELYENNPEIYYYDKHGKFYTNWEEFASYYAQTAQKKKTVLKKAPTLFEKELTEKDFFQESERDVDVVFNARYCPPFWHDLRFIKIMYVLNGEFEINISKEQKIKLTKGNFIIVPPNIMQSVFSYHDDDIVINIFLKLSTFEKAFASMLMEADEISLYFWQILYGKDESNIILFRCEEDMFLRNLIIDVIEERQQKHQGSNFLMVSYVMTFVAYALVNLRQTMMPIEDTKICKTKFAEIIQYIRENYNNVTLSVLAERFHRNESYLSRYIKTETGYSLVQLLKQYRIKQAGILLRETDCSVENIMFEVGYTDISYFYKVFKEYYGMTPKQYRELETVIRLR